MELDFCFDFTYDGRRRNARALERAHVVTVERVRDELWTIRDDWKGYFKGFLVARGRTRPQLDAGGAAQRRRSSVLSPWLDLVEK